MFNKGNNVQILVGQHKDKIGEIVEKTIEVGGIVLYHVLITDIKPNFTMVYLKSEIKLP
jgi:hypothetical protein